MSDTNFWLRQPTIKVLHAAYLLASERIPSVLSESVNIRGYPAKVQAILGQIQADYGAVVRVRSVGNKGETQVPPTVITQDQFRELQKKLGVSLERSLAELETTDGLLGELFFQLIYDLKKGAQTLRNEKNTQAAALLELYAQAAEKKAWDIGAADGRKSDVTERGLVAKSAVPVQSEIKKRVQTAARTCFVEKPYPTIKKVMETPAFVAAVNEGRPGAIPASKKNVRAWISEVVPNAVRIGGRPPGSSTKKKPLPE